jgi:predicted Rossmann fold flavoprotein
LEYRDGKFLLTTNRAKFRAKAVVVATGGLSFAKLGATGVGFEIAKSFGHNINRLSPALVGLTLQKEHSFLKSLSGVSTQVVVKVGDKTFQDNLLFTHRGISGPVILNSSLYWQKGSIEIDFLPNFTLQKAKKSLSNSLPLPKSLSKALISHLNIQDKPTNLLTQSELDRLKILNSFKLSPSGTFGFSRAEVTKGGVAVDEIDSNMMSRVQEGLFFVGEVLDVTGELGGYNLQWAFSSAYLCAKYLNSHLL